LTALNIAEFGNRSVLRRVSLVEPEGIIEGHLALWGSPAQRDEYGTWFDRESPPEMALDFLPFPMSYEHFGDDITKIVAEMYTVWPDADGIRYRAKLDRQRLDDDEFERIVGEIKRGELGTSSASAEHIAQFDEDGRFVRWLLSEVSLTKSPAERRMPSVVLVRSKIQPVQSEEDNAARCDDCPDNAQQKRNSEDITMPESKRQLPADALNPDLASGLQALVDAWGVDVVMDALKVLGGGESEEDETMMSAETVNMEDLRSMVQKLGEQKQRNAETARITALENEVKQLRMRKPAPAGDETPEFVTLPAPRTPQIRGMTPRNLVGKTAADLATAYMIKRSLIPEEMRAVPGVRPLRDETTRALADMVFAEAEKGNSHAESAVRSLRYAVGSNATRADIMGSDVTGYGDEWVGVFYEETLWEKIRIAPIWETLRAKGLNEKAVPRGYESATIPLEGADPTWYKVAQAANISASGLPEGVPASKVGTSNTSVTTSEVAALVWYNDTLEEDSIVDAASNIRRQMEISAREQVEYLLINGDTETAASTNINKVDDTPAANVSYLAFNGFLKLPLVTNTANARDAGTTFDENDFRLLLTLLGTNGRAASDRRMLAFLMDFATQDAALAIPAFASRDVYSNATIETGELVKAYNVDILVSDQMALANSSGKISVTAANNTRGRILLIRPDQWWIGRKREMTVATQRWEPARSTAIVTSFRMGLTYRSTDTGDSAAAVSYNVAVS
jgi:hypothetical protein